MSDAPAAQDGRTPLRVVIAGGGTAGWMTAAGLLGVLGTRVCDVRLIESDEIGTVGVGEATLPHMRAFNEAVGIVEADMMRRTQATFKLGIAFVGWGAEPYFHPFGAYGKPLGGTPFHHQWTRARRAGFGRPLADYSMAVAAARANRFDFPSSDRDAAAATFDYAYHFDAGLYAAFLRSFCERRGAVRTEGRIVDVALDGGTGAIASLTLASGEIVEGDLFVDCSGFRALLIGDAMHAAWEDWSRWLPCDRALAVPSEPMDDIPPFTRATAREAGWQWCIPLQHRTGNGHIYSSAFTDEARAVEMLMANLPGPALGDPRPLKFQAGRRLGAWTRNCVAVGLAGGFLEPLESTSIYLIQAAVTSLIKLFPERGIDPALASEFNRSMDVEYARIRDFLILHYHANAGQDGEMWRHCRAMAVPDSLAETIALFRARGHVPSYKDGLFTPPSWLSVLVGQGIAPRAYQPRADALPHAELAAGLDGIAARIAAAVSAMPAHGRMLADYCPAPAATAARRPIAA